MTFSFSSIERAAIVANRRRVEAHGERVRRRTGTNGLLERTICLDRLAKGASDSRPGRSRTATGQAKESTAMTERKATGWHYTLHVTEQPQIRAEQKPGTGIDRTLIRRLLAVSPSERVKLLVDEANNLADFDRKFRRR
jgi:hypothetical protein